MRKISALLQRDVRGIYRDGFLIMMCAYSLVIAAATRVVVRFVPVNNIEMYVAPFVIITACSLTGLVFGFGLIEERETKTSLLLRVLPLSSAALTAYWIGLVSVFCLVIMLLSAVIYGLSPAMPGMFLLLATVTALGAPLVMLLLGAIATNKIEGLAVGKIISGSSLVLIGIFVLPTIWGVLLIWYPWYWLYLGLLRAYAGPDLAGTLAVSWPTIPIWGYVLIPLALSVSAIVALAHRYRRIL